MVREWIIEVDGLTCRIGGHEILRGVSFRVRRGEVLFIIGPNGAGKTTLLKCLNRLIDATDGRVRVEGEEVAGWSQRRIARHLSYVPQLRTASLSYRVEEFVLLSRYAFHPAFSAPGKADHDAVVRALSLTRMSAFRGRRLNTLSGGECQKVFIAAALAQETPILLLDEPTTFLDPRYQFEVNALLADLNQAGELTLVAVSHDINAAALHAHRILGLRDGRVEAEGTPAEMMRAEVLERIFGMSFLLTEHPHTGHPIVVPRN